jgi:hypothetical protein
MKAIIKVANTLTIEVDGTPEEITELCKKLGAQVTDESWEKLKKLAEEWAKDHEDKWTSKPGVGYMIQCPYCGMWYYSGTCHSCIHWRRYPDYKPVTIYYC